MAGVSSTLEREALDLLRAVRERLGLGGFPEGADPAEGWAEVMARVELPVRLMVVAIAEQLRLTNAGALDRAVEMATQSGELAGGGEWDPERHTGLAPRWSKPEPQEGVRGDGQLEAIFRAEQEMRRTWGREFTYRDFQEEYAKLVDQAQREGLIALLEAGTGTGKSLGYLLPSAINALRGYAPIVISCHTLNLQEQLMGKEIPRLRCCLGEGVDFRVELFKGREHYFCNLRLRRLMEEGSFQQMVRDLLSRHRVSEREFPYLAQRVGHWLIYLVFWLTLTDEGDFARLDYTAGLGPELVSSLKNYFSAKLSTCLTERCPLKGSCFYYRKRERCRNSHLVITNHALFFSLFRADDEEERDTVIDRSAHIIFDEAHQLEEVIISRELRELSSAAVADFCRRAEEIFKEPAFHTRFSSSHPHAREAEELMAELAELIGGVNEAREELDEWSREHLLADEETGEALEYEVDLEEREERGDSSRPDSEAFHATRAKELLPLINRLGERLARLGERVSGVLRSALDEESPLYLSDQDFQLRVRELLGIWDSLRELISRLGENELYEDVIFVRSFALHSSQRNPWTLRTLPLSASQTFAELARRKRSLVLTSATLSVSGSFDYLIGSLGLEGEEERLITRRFPSPYDYERQAMLLVVRDLAGFALGGKDREEYQQALARAVAELALAAGGGTMALFANRRDLLACSRWIRRRLGEELLVLCQGEDGERHQMLERFRSHSRALLLGLASFWEGVDVPGESLRQVIITKLPFLPFDSPRYRQLRRIIREQGESDFMRLSLPQAVLRFVQGFGRLIRSETDRGVCVVLDSRMVEKSYGQYFLRSLPVRPVLGRLDEVVEKVRRFFAEEQVAREEKE